MSDEKVELEDPASREAWRFRPWLTARCWMLLGHVQSEPVILVRRARERFAIGSVCTHYNGPLAELLLRRRRDRISEELFL